MTSSSLARTLLFQTQCSFDAAARGAFLHLSSSEARSMLDKISGKTPYTSNHNKLLEEKKESSPEQEEEVLIAKSQPLQSQDLAINPEPPIPQNLWQNRPE